MTNKKKAYLVKSQEAYDRLMKELEEESYLWLSGKKPTKNNSYLDAITDYADGMCIYLNSKLLSRSSFKDFREFRSDDYNLIEYPEPSDYPGKEWTGKLELSYVPSQIIRDIAEVRMYGNAKYKDPDNWRVVPTKQWVDALYRHMLEFIDNPRGVDSESGIPHYKHMACNLAFICELMKEREDEISDMIKNGINVAEGIRQGLQSQNDSIMSTDRSITDSFRELKLEMSKMEEVEDEKRKVEVL